jgi:hypothetical protein
LISISKITHTVAKMDFIQNLSEKIQQMKLAKRMKIAQCIKPTFCTPCPSPNRKFKSHNL